MTEWVPMGQAVDGLRASVAGASLYVFPSGVMGWSWHATVFNVIHVQGYADTLEAAKTLAEEAAREAK